MASTEETKYRPYSVSEYHFVDEKAECVSFHVLPLQWSDGERQGGEKVKIFLHGTADNGFQIICKHVIAWKFDISSEEPEILVLSEGNSWIKLGKPRKSFEDTVRSILITVHYIHYVTRNPEKSVESAWNHLSEVFRFYAVKPSQRDLVDHMPLISDCVNRYCGLEESKFLAKLLEEKTMKRKLSDDDADARNKLKLIIDDKKDDKSDDADDKDNDNLFGEVCALCDDGGKITCCEGGCLRSFHATEEAGAGSFCKSLGFKQNDIAGMQNFYCKNCEHKQHQCFICGKLGSSDKSSGAVEVVSCVAQNCGRFYHPYCVAILLSLENGVPAEELVRKIAGGESFTCPIHKCFICKQGEIKKDRQLQFAVCMRCPKSYHRKCLPREIAFENQGEMLEGRSITRAWDGLLPNRILIHCTNHDIDIEIGTVGRDHIKFPDVKQNTSTFNKKTILEEKWKPITEFLVDGDKVVSKRDNSLENSHGGKVGFIKKPFVKNKKTRDLTSDQKPVSKEINSSSEESVGQRSDPVRSKLVKQKLSSVKKAKTILNGKTIVEKKEGPLASTVSVSKRTATSSEGLFRAGSAPTVSKEKENPSFFEEKCNKPVKKKTIVEEKRTLTSESLVDKDPAVSGKNNPSLKELYRETNASITSNKKQKPSPIQEKISLVEEKRKLTLELTVDGHALSKKETALEESLSVIASTSAVKLFSNKNMSLGIEISRMVKQNSLLKKKLQMESEKIKTSLCDELFSSMESEQVKLGNLDTPDANTAIKICGNDGYQHPNTRKSCLHCVPANGQIQSNIPDNAGRRCTMSKDEPCSRFTSCGSGNEKGYNRENYGRPYLIGTKQKTEFDIACIRGKQNPVFSSNDLAGQNSISNHNRTLSSTFYSHIGPVVVSLANINRLAMSPDATKLVDPTALGFAPGPHLNFSLQNSAGWFDE
ncbi:uncharacterized protein LOC126792847 [Argentina anserina]|uniref:uncharacterized protein LOC126792847 n=1 Tax=Argentina anserina TaxID=57926 RepID=UPI0021766C54|nr:uncharacterized protein LOC126792847 [Potentilla anserina]XP_050375283.1 uncharacterized protein LOC126792847 [Potentilla anserina]